MAKKSIFLVSPIFPIFGAGHTSVMSYVGCLCLYVVYGKENIKPWYSFSISNGNLVQLHWKGLVISIREFD